MGAGVKGTIAGTGPTAAASGAYIDIALDFSGVATVDIEKQMPSGVWIKIETSITADYNKVYSSTTEVNLRLNCTAFTNAVEYSLAPGARP